MFITFIIICTKLKTYKCELYYYCYSCSLTPSVCKHFWAPTKYQSWAHAAETAVGEIKSFLGVHPYVGRGGGSGRDWVSLKGWSEDLKSALTGEQGGSLVLSRVLNYQDRKKWPDKQMFSKLLAYLSFFPFNIPASQHCTPLALHSGNHQAPVHLPPCKRPFTTCN